MTNENSTVLNKVEGSVLTDGLIKNLQVENAARHADAKTIGQLKGEIEILRSKLAESQRKAEDKEKHVTVTLYTDTSEPGQPVTANLDPWGDIWTTTSSNRRRRGGSSYIDKIEGISMGDLSKLVNNAVKDEADQLVKSAQDDINKAERAKERAEKELKDYKKYVTEQEKALKEKIEKAVEKAQKDNIEIIERFKKDVKVKEAQLEQNKKELDLYMVERDLSVESLTNEIELLKKHIELLQIEPKDIVAKVKQSVVSWGFKRRLNSALNN